MKSPDLSRAKRILRRLERVLFARRAYKFMIRDWIALSDLKAASDVMGTMRFLRHLEPLVVERPRGKRILVIAPHPDDEVLAAMGTLLKARAGGATIHTAYLTTGLDSNISEISSISETAGYSIEFFDYDVSGIPLNDNSIARLHELFEKRNPDTLFLPFLLDDHDDHRRASDLLYNYAKTFNLKRSIEVWGYQVYTSLMPNVVVDITDLADVKAKLIRRMTGRMAKREWAHYALGLNAFNCRFLPKANEKKYVEAFFVTPMKEYLLLCDKYFSADPTTCYYGDYYTRK